MKATYNGINMEGTPKEIAELKKLLDDQWKQQLNTKPPYNPYQPQTVKPPYYYPNYPSYPWGTWIGNGTYTVPTGTTVTSWNSTTNDDVRIRALKTGTTNNAKEWVDCGWTYTGA